MPAAPTAILILKLTENGREVCRMALDTPAHAKIIAEALVRSDQCGGCFVTILDQHCKYVEEVFPPPDEDEAPAPKRLPKPKHEALKRDGNVIQFPRRPTVGGK